MNFKQLKRNFLIIFVAFIGALSCLTLINDTSKTVTTVQTVKAAKKAKKIKYYDIRHDSNADDYYDLGHGKFVRATGKVQTKAVRIHNKKKKSKFMIDGQCIVKFNKKSKTLHISAGNKGNKLGKMDLGLAPGTAYSNGYEYHVAHISIDSKIVAPKNSWGLFSRFTKLNNFIGLDNVDTSKVTNMRNMFDSDKRLKSLDLSSWNTSKVTDMLDMFVFCSKLTSLNLSGWDTSKVTDMSSMFEGCSKLTSLDLSSWDTSKVTDMSDMFAGCSCLSEDKIKVKNDDLSKLGNEDTNTDAMFDGTLDPNKNSDNNDDEDSNDYDDNDENEDSDDNDDEDEDSNNEVDEDSNDDYDQDDANYVYNLNAVEIPKLDFNRNK